MSPEQKNGVEAPQPLSNPGSNEEKAVCDVLKAKLGSKGPKEDIKKAENLFLKLNQINKDVASNHGRVHSELLKIEQSLPQNPTSRITNLTTAQRELLADAWHTKTFDFGKGKFIKPYQGYGVFQRLGDVTKKEAIEDSLMAKMKFDISSDLPISQPVATREKSPSNQSNNIVSEAGAGIMAVSPDAIKKRSTLSDDQ